MESTTQTSTRISREEWLEHSLDWLEHSKGYFRLDDLVKTLGVTTGSFYWHFKGKDDFIQSLLDYWEVTTTSNVFAHMQSFTDADAKTQLLELMRVLRNKTFCRHDIAVRNLAIWHQGAAKKVAEVDKMRLGFVRKLFAGMGFSGDELEARAHAFAVFHSLHEGFYAKELTDSETELKAMFEMFTRK
jgi:AcrR family transcriptional regulator